MSSPGEVNRRLNQHGSDIDELYEITTRTEEKVDALAERFGSLDRKVDRLAEQTVGPLHRLAERTEARFEQVDRRFESIEGTLGQHGVLLARILQRLDQD